MYNITILLCRKYRPSMWSRKSIACKNYFLKKGGGVGVGDAINDFLTKVWTSDEEWIM